MGPDDDGRDWSKELPVSLLSRTTLADVAQLHFVEFTKKVAEAVAGAPGYRLDECESYWWLWNGERERLSLADPPPMPRSVYNEYCDALFCGDYDEYLKPEELATLQKYSGEVG